MLSKERSYGISERVNVSDACDEHAERLKTLGDTVVDGGYSAAELKEFSAAFDVARRLAHDAAGGVAKLREIDEHNTVRAPFYYDSRLLKLATNPIILEIASRLIAN